MRAGIWKFKLHTNVAWLKKAGVRGVVIGYHIYFAEPRWNITGGVFRHELEHAYQILRDGLFLFYLKYFYYSVRYGYKDNPYEIEAREAQKYLLHPDEEELLWTLKDD